MIFKSLHSKGVYEERYTIEHNKKKGQEPDTQSEIFKKSSNP